jgi:peptidoglycan/LPS O-acetylase OafA/YrhL
MDRIAFLDGLRGLAALYVMLGHARWLLWEGFSDGFALHPERYSLLGKVGAYASLALYYGHQAVILFFVLSGFVIHVRQAQRLQQERTARLDVRRFMVRRFWRIYPTFFFALLATLVIDQVGIAQGYSIYSGNTPYDLINRNVKPDFSLPVAVGHLLLIPDVPAWGSNGPLWSLRVEWWFYLLYPLVWVVRRRSLRLATVIVGGLCFLSFFPSLWAFSSLPIVFGAFPAWWMGALLAELYAGNLPVKFVQVAPLAVLFLILPLLVAPFVQLNATVQDFVWALGFTGLLAACFAWQGRKGSLRVLERFRWLGDISYSLYVIHFPLLVLLGGWLMSRTPDGTLPQGFEWVAIGALLCVVAAYAVHRVVERPFFPRQRSSE